MMLAGNGKVGSLRGFAALDQPWSNNASLPVDVKSPAGWAAGASGGVISAAVGENRCGA